MPAINSAVERFPANDKHHAYYKLNASSNNPRGGDDSDQQTSTGYAKATAQSRRPSVTFDLPPARFHPGDESHQHRKRVSTHSKTSSIGSIGGQSTTSSISSSVSSNNSAATTPTSATSPARRQLRKKQRASTVSSYIVAEHSSSPSATMRFGVKLDFNKRSSKRISQDSMSKDLPPLPHEVLDKRVSGRLPLPPLDINAATGFSPVQAALLSPRSQEETVLHIQNNDRRRSSIKSRTDLPPLPTDAPNHHRHRTSRALSSAQHLAEVKRQTELWLSMLCSSDEGDNLFTPSLSSSSSNSSLNGKVQAPSSGCCDPDFLVSDKAHAEALTQLPVPSSSPIVPSPFMNNEAPPFNPFEASFMAGPDCQSLSSEVILPNRRRSSLPTHQLTDNSIVQKRLDKHRPPPLSLAPMQDSPAEESSAVQTAIPPPPPQYRARSLSHDLRPLDPISLYHRRFHRSSQDTTDLNTSTSRSRENSISSSSAASMIFTSSNDSSMDNGSTGRRFSNATTSSSNMPSPKSPNHPRTPTLQDLLEEAPCTEKMDTSATKDRKRELSGRHSKQGSTGSVEIVMYGVAQ